MQARVVKILFYGLSTTLTLLTFLRMKWSWPDVTWQSQFWIINDIDNLMSHNFSRVTWFELANREWSLNGWRWFSYINAYFFSWNMSYELLFYALTLLGIVILIGHSIFTRPFKWDYKSVLLLSLIVFVLFSFSGAGARGMELGTYIGIFFTVLLFKIAFSEGKNLPLSLFLPPVIVFIFFGGYAISVTMILLLLSVLVLRKVANFKIFPNLIIATISCTASLGLYAVVFLSRASQAPSALLSFFNYLQTNTLYPPKFLFYAPLGGLVTIQNIEGLTSKKTTSMTIVYGIFLFLLFLFCITFAFVHRRNEMLPPLALILYSIGTSVTIMITRLTGDFGMWSPWYSLHLKVGIVGCLWLLILFKSNSDLVFFRLDWLISLTAILLVFILIFANITQWKRQPYERAYFKEIQKVTLFPETLTVGTNGLTPLLIGLEDSKKAINILEKHKIGIYRDAVKAKKDFMGDAKFLPIGDIFADGWVGPNPKYLFQKGACKLIVFKLSNPPKLFQSQANLIIDGVLTKTFDIANVPYVLKIKNTSNVNFVEFKFNQSLIPAENDLGPDLRNLSASVAAKCE
jgi:hypothetical protein